MFVDNGAEIAAMTSPASAITTYATATARDISAARPAVLTPNYWGPDRPLSPAEYDLAGQQHKRVSGESVGQSARSTRDREYQPDPGTGSYAGHGPTQRHFHRGRLTLSPVGLRAKHVQVVEFWLVGADRLQFLEERCGGRMAGVGHRLGVAEELRHRDVAPGPVAIGIDD